MVVGISEVETKTIASANVTRDVNEYCATHTCDIILYELPYWFEDSNNESKNTSNDSVSDHELPSITRKVKYRDFPVKLTETCH